MSRNDKETKAAGRSIMMLFFCCLLALLALQGCARMGSPDGGWYDETPPKVIGATPADRQTNVREKKINIYFDEYIKVDNPSENVVVSPPQTEAPEIKPEGKKISIKLIDNLKDNTTYTVDFSNAISDNNEDNPLGNYTYSFSTGDHIDTLEVSGYVLNAADLEPIKGILVGLYDNLNDTAFTRTPMIRVSRTDARGHFTIKGVAPGNYHIYALQDMDNDFRFGQKSEKIAFNNQLITPAFKPDVRQDTLWLDSLRIKAINRVSYTRFLPDDITLMAFNEVMTTRNFLKVERKNPNAFSLFYTYGDSILPKIEGLNFNANNAFMVEESAKRDTLTYWLRDTTLINQDTLRMAITTHISDSAGVLRLQTDTIEALAKTPYEKRMKDLTKKMEEWKKDQEKKKKKGERYDSIYPKEQLKLEVQPSGEMAPDRFVTFRAAEPLEDVDSALVHIYSHPEKDSVWYKERFVLERVDLHSYRLRAAWKPGTEYSIEADSGAFRNIYGVGLDSLKQGLKVGSEDSYSSLLVSIQGLGDKPVVAELLDGQGNIVKQVNATKGQAEFYFIKEGTYYLRAFVDANNNGVWDTGEYATQRQPEDVYYYPEKIDCKAKWDVSRDWNPTALPRFQQKPSALIKQKEEANKKKVKSRNLERAKQLGIKYMPSV